MRTLMRLEAIVVYYHVLVDAAPLQEASDKQPSWSLVTYLPLKLF